MRPGFILLKILNTKKINYVDVYNQTLACGASAGAEKKSKSFSRRHSVASVNFGGKASPPIDAENTEFRRIAFCCFAKALNCRLTTNQCRLLKVESFFQEVAK